MDKNLAFRSKVWYLILNYINYYCQATAGLHSIETAEESAGLPFRRSPIFMYFSKNYDERGELKSE